MKEVLHKRSFFILLLPIFFVLHGYVAHAGFVELKSAVLLLCMFLTGAGILYLIFRLLLKQPLKAGFMAMYCLGFYLFFGAIYDTLKAYSPWSFVYKYSVLLFTFFIIGSLLFMALRRTKKEFSKLAFFFNLLFIILIVFDLFILVSKQKNIVAKSDNRRDSTGIIPDSCDKPDIYLLLFDEYAGNISLHEWLQFDNSSLDSFLLSRKFRVMKSPKSNYDATPLSMASLLNMDYMPWYKPLGIFTKEEWVISAMHVKHNKVVAFLGNNGYEIVNLSIFDLNNHPAPIDQRFLAVNTRLITEETLLSRVLHDFSWVLIQYPVLAKIFPANTYDDQAKNIERSIALTIEESTKKSNKPRFVYTHLLVPHLPALFDREGKRKTDLDFKDRTDPRESFGDYLEHVRFANLQLKKIVGQIQQHDPKAVILFMSDHGFRWTKDPQLQPLVFNNQNAVYLPDQKYTGWNDSVTNVNQFRILFNTLFAQQLPILKDSFISTPR